MTEAMYPIAAAFIGVVSGFAGLWIKNLLNRVDSMEKRVVRRTEDKIDLEIEVVLEKVRSIEKQVNSIDAKMDKLYEMLLDFSK